MQDLQNSQDGDNAKDPKTEKTPTPENGGFRKMERGSGADGSVGTSTSLPAFNNFMSAQHHAKVKDDMDQLKIKIAGAAFFKKLELSLNLCLLEILRASTRGEQGVQINLKALNGSKAKQEGLQVTLPLEPDTCLPLVSHVSTNMTKGAALCVKILGVTWQLATLRCYIVMVMVQ